MTDRTIAIPIAVTGHTVPGDRRRWRFAPGAFYRGGDPTRVRVRSWSGVLVGRGVEFTESPSGVVMLRAHISDTREGRESLTLWRDGVLSAAHVGFETLKASWDGRELHRDAVRVGRVGLRERTISYDLLGVEPTPRTLPSKPATLRSSDRSVAYPGPWRRPGDPLPAWYANIPKPLPEREPPDPWRGLRR